MEAAYRPSLASRWLWLRGEIAAEARLYWTGRRAWVVAAAVMGILLLELAITGAFYAGESSQLGRGPHSLRFIAGSLGFVARWALPLFTTAPPPDDPLAFTFPEKSPARIVEELLLDILGMLLGVIAPVIAARSFSAGWRRDSASVPHSVGRALLVRGAGVVGPVALAALGLAVLALFVRTVHDAFAGVPPGIGLYPGEVFVGAGWGFFAAESVRYGIHACTRSALLVCIAASLRRPAFAMVVCLVLTHLGIGVLASAVPWWLAPYSFVLVEGLLLCVAVPLALFALREADDDDHAAPPELTD